LSDGDNIQYNQHAMRRIWDRAQGVRGQRPLNWTIAPGLVDIAPGIMNYYYSTATANDCFVGGPSGMGYTMPVNTLREPGADLGVHAADLDKWAAYVQLTARYASRAGLRVITVWDNLTAEQRALYEQHCADLVGVTVQNFRDDPTVASSVANNRLRFEKLEIAYAGNAQQLIDSIGEQHQQWDGKSPRFVAYQCNIWSQLHPERLMQLMREVELAHANVVFVRADHYFELQRQSRETNR
jgi:hypothetical protein